MKQGDLEGDRPMTHTPESAGTPDDGDQTVIDALARANIVALAAELVERGCPAEGLIDPDAAEEDDEERAEYRMFAVQVHPGLERWVAMPGVDLALVRAAGPDDPWAVECDMDPYAWPDLIAELADDALGWIAFGRNLALVRDELARRGLVFHDKDVSTDVDACGGGYEAFTLHAPNSVVIRLGVPNREAGPGSRAELFVNGYGHLFEQAIESILQAAATP
ncbi:hypothetical protein [Yinghuangia soli]|uniref:Uncharacterized protein n=1 Tax=Yinghuangia soli TaxID=2908204 RepID=A0AA41Q299_9ACTN|nr:hypothetical protein [Yinghuangia soli]MCF2528777.1 hypothetical protein [Yinghuangia soli]